MRRREFIAGLGAVITPAVARAQPSVIPVIGYLYGGRHEPHTRMVTAFRQGLTDAGFVEGRNVEIEFRWANLQSERLPTLADELVRRQVVVIVATGGLQTALAAKAATSKIPIVSIDAYDLVKYGLVTSLNRPGGNVTGVTYLGSDLGGKRLSLLHELVPQVTTVAYLTGSLAGSVARDMRDEIVAAAGALGLQVIVLAPRNDRDFDATFATLVKNQAGALIVGQFSFLSNNGGKIRSLAMRHNIPAIYPNAGYVRAGGLMSYGVDDATSYRQAAAIHVARILKGAKPAELPVMQATKFDLALNLNTAKALGLTIPETLLATADEVIQ
jgi:putative tryptophan/tyrosine transport system substrate-binding protein